MRKAGSPQHLSDRVVLQGKRRGLLDLSVCLSAGPADVPGGLDLLGSLLAAATSEGIRRDTGIISWLHWPNLVTMDDRVVAKASISPRQASGPNRRLVVARILVDCFASSSYKLTLAELPSISILEALGVEIDMDIMREKVLHAVNWYHAEWERGMNVKLVQRVRPTVHWLGRKVELVAPGGSRLSGRAKGLDDFGSLLLETKDSRGRLSTRVVAPGTVDFVRVVD